MKIGNKVKVNNLLSGRIIKISKNYTTIISDKTNTILKLTKNNLIDFKRIKYDGNGNPRYVCHFLNFADNYPRALFLANKIGGRKFHNKQYGGGIVFQSYNVKNLESQILKIKENA